MSLLAVVEVDGVEAGESLELGAFVNGECRGSVALRRLPALGMHVAFLTVHGDGGDEVEFRLYDPEAGEEFPSAGVERVVFQANGVVGSIGEPYTLHFKGLDGEEEREQEPFIYPNPTEGVVNVNSNGVKGYAISDLAGHVLTKIHINQSSFRIDMGAFAPGTYLLTLNTSSGAIVTRLVTVIR